MLKLPPTTSTDDFISLSGGFDLSTPTLSLSPGMVRKALNFECNVSGGYSRIAGYERFDGRTNPSDAQYLAMTVTITGAISAGDAITGATSGATGVVIYATTSLVVYTRAVGAFQDGETVNVSAAPQATITDLGGSDNAIDFDTRMRNLAADEYRGDILVVPGSGRIRGVVHHGGVVYAFRNNAAGTATDIYKSTAGGWVQVAMQYSVPFSAGTSEYVDGESVTQGADSATVLRVCLESGSWGAGTAAGRLIITQPTPTPFAAGAAAGDGACTLSGASAQIALLPGGSLEFDIGTVGSVRRVYAVDGVNKAFEFDGTVLVPIVTGNSPDIPNRVMVHSGHLFLAFGNSVQHSGIGTPFDWTTIAGAGELLADGNVTVMNRMSGDQTTGAAAIFHEEGMQILYGTSGANFQLSTFEDSTGAKAMTGQRMGQMYVLDDRGVTSMAASQNYGNFSSSTLTFNIRSWIQSRRNLVTASCVNRERNQYRLFFSDGAALYLTIVNGKFIGAMPQQFDNTVRCICTGDTPDGAETSFFGSDNGYVYRNDVGTSFDGGEIPWDLMTVYAHQGGLRQEKRYRKATFEVQGDTYAEFLVQFDIAYGSTERAQQEAYDVSAVNLEQVYWDDFTWDQFTWDGRGLSPSEVAIEGSGENIAVRVTGASDMYGQFTLNSLILTYSPRRRKR